MEKKVDPLIISIQIAICDVYCLVISYGKFQELRCQKAHFIWFRWEEQLLLKYRSISNIVLTLYVCYIQECELIGLGQGKHKIHLEINVYGLTEPFRTKAITCDVGYEPEAPRLTYELPGMEQRAKLDRIAASLANKRDRLLRVCTAAASGAGTGFATPSSAAAQRSSSVDKLRMSVPKAMAMLRQVGKSSFV